jgi:hypothetical protein
MFKCSFCDKVINNKGSLVNHQNRCKLNPNKKVFVSNFVEYNEKIKKGEIVKYNTNQVTKAKNEGKIHIVSEETRKKIGKSHKGKTISKEQKEKLSLYRSKILEELGIGGFKTIKWYKFKNINEEEFILRGRWELNVAEILNENKVYWIRKVYIPYIDSEGIKRTYTPDFYLPNLDRYIEVKGYFSEKDQTKIELVKKQNDINLILIREKDFNDKLIENIVSDNSSLFYI